jgi:hypothetical protein
MARGLKPRPRGPLNSASASSLISALVLACGLAWTADLCAEVCEQYDDYLHVSGTADVPGVARDTAVAGTLAYVAVDRIATSDGELRVIDISDPAQPRLLGAVELPFPGYGVAISGTTACVAARQGGLIVVDVADPRAPTMVGHLDTPSMGYGVALTDKLALLASYDAGLYAIDVADPTQPQALGTLPTPDAALAVTVQDGHAFVAVDWAGLLVVDISEPMALAALDTLPLPGRARNVTAAAERLYVAAGLEGGVQAVDIHDPSATEVVGSVDVYSAFDVAVHGELLYATGYLSLFTVDVHDPSQMSVLGEIGMGASGMGVAAAGYTACTAAAGQGLRLVDATQPRAMSMVGAIPTPGSDDGGYVAWGYPHAYVVWSHCNFAGGCYAGLQIIGLEDPSAPEPVGALELPPAAAGAALAGDHLLIGSSVGLLVVDVSDPAQPATIRELPEFTGTRSLATVGARGYVAHDDQLTILDLTIPAEPLPVGSLVLPDPAVDLVVQGDLVLAAAGGSGLLVVDVADPTAPVLMAARPAQRHAYGLGAAEGYAYVVGSGFCDVFDLEDPSDPTVVGSVDPHVTFVRDALVVDRTLYVGAMSAGMQVYTLADPASPRYLGSVSTGNYAHRLAPSDAHVLVSDLDRLSVAPRECTATALQPPPRPTDPVLFAYPNPFNPKIVLEFVLPQASVVRLDVYDLRGRKLIDLADGPLPAGNHRLVWDGRDDGDRAVASGTYVARLNVGSRSTSRKIVLVR